MPEPGFLYICVVASPDFENMLVDSSRLLADLVVEEVGRDETRMAELFRLATERNDQIAMRAARAFDLVDEKYPGMALPYVQGIRNRIRRIPHQSVVRCFLRTLMRYPLPDDDEELGRFYQLTIDLMVDTAFPVAIRYYGMHLGYTIACQLPDLRFELIPIYGDIAKESLQGLAGRAKFFRFELIRKYGQP